MGIELIKAVLLIVGITLLLSFWSAQAPAQSLTLQEFSIDVWKIDNYRNPYFGTKYAQPDYKLFPDTDRTKDQYETWVYGIATNFNLRLIGQWFWDNTVYMNATDHQPRDVGWKFKQRYELTDRFHVFWQHHSEHEMDGRGDGSYFPLQDTFGFRLRFK